jgi:hypothetical protein
MPALYRLLDHKSPGEFQPFAARCLYYHSRPPASAIVLEDLKEQGFRMADRTVGLDMQHCLLVIKAMAQSHAASAVLHLKDPEIFSPFSESFYCVCQPSTIKLFIHTNMKNLAKEVETWPLFNDRFASKLHRVADKAVDYLIKFVKRDEDDFNSFIHGDFWQSNIMFRYSDDTDEVMDVRYIAVN